MKGVVLGSAQHSISRLAPNWQPANPPMTPPATQRITVSARADRCWLDPGLIQALIQAMFAAIPAPRPAHAMDILVNVVREMAPMRIYGLQATARAAMPSTRARPKPSGILAPRIAAPRPRSAISVVRIFMPTKLHLSRVACQKLFKRNRGFSKIVRMRPQEGV